MEDFLFNNAFENIEDLYSFFLNPNPILNKDQSLKIDKPKMCCGIDLIIDNQNSILVCTTCGDHKKEMILKTWENEEKYMKRKKFTGKECTYNNFLNRYFCDVTNVPPILIDEILKLELKSKIEIRDFLKEKKLFYFLNQTRYIWYRMTGERIDIKNEDRKTLFTFFLMIKDTFIRLVQANILQRKNLWLYEFIFLKSIEHFNFNYLLDQINFSEILKSKPNIKVYNKEWEIMCIELKIKFIKY